MMDERNKTMGSTWVFTEKASQWSTWHQARRSDGSLEITVEITRCMGDTDRQLSVWRKGIRVLYLLDPWLAGVAFSADFRGMVTRGGRQETWYDTVTGKRIERPEKHDIADEVLLTDLIPELREGSMRAADPVDRFLGEIVDTQRHSAIDTWDDARRQGLIKDLLARTPKQYSSERELEGILLLLGGWHGPAAEQAAQEVSTALATWPPSHLKVPDWLDWRVRDPRWRFFRSVSIRIEGDQALDEVRTLVQADYLPPVATLTVAGPIGEQGAALLAGWPGFASITSLQLRDCSLGDAGASALADSSHLGRYTHLEITRSDIGDEGAVALSRVLRFVEGGELNLYGNHIGDEGAKAIATRDRSCGLFKHLNLGGNRIGPMGAQALAKAGYRDPVGARGGPVVLLHDQAKT